MTLAHVEAILGGEMVLGKKIRNRMDLMELSRIGVSKKAANNLANYLDLSQKQLAVLLSVSEKIIQSYRMEQNFNFTISERILQIAEVTAKGMRVFGQKKLFIQWLHSPVLALGGRKPFELLNSTFGSEILMQELGRIEHGVYS